MTEKELEAEVLALADKMRLAVLVIPDSRRLVYGPGYPDLTVFGRSGVLYRELKTEGGKLSRPQVAWKYKIQGTGGNWGIWRPGHLAAGRIEYELWQVAG
jgi:hypothetical protein